LIIAFFVQYIIIQRNTPQKKVLNFVQFYRFYPLTGVLGQLCGLYKRTERGYNMAQKTAKTDQGGYQNAF
ncbi:MAG: hypothetical protein MJ118_06825, partial [Clostridia bacterium]|nr:hypothetical protein [Clostridia bacterium]